VENLSHRWIRCSADGTGCFFVHEADNDAKLGLAAGDLGRRFKLRVTGEAALGTTEVDSVLSDPVAALPPSVVAAAVISGSARAGSRLSVGQDAVFEGSGPIALAREWLRCDAQGGACTGTGSFGTSYELGAADVGHTIRLRVRGTGPDGQFIEVDSAPSEPVAAAAGKKSKRAPAPLRPFPRVVVAGAAFPRGASLTRLLVRGPRGARVRASCRARGAAPCAGWCAACARRGCGSADSKRTYPWEP
jgi:hypothetical protein